MKEEKLRDGELTQDIIAAALAVHRALGPGYLESFYEAAMCIELAAQSIPFERQVPLPIRYRNHLVGEHRLDLLVEGRVVVELKAASALESIHFATVRSYMKAADVQTGLLINFASPILTVKRVYRERGEEAKLSRPKVND